MLSNSVVEVGRWHGWFARRGGKRGFVIISQSVGWLRGLTPHTYSPFLQKHATVWKVKRTLIIFHFGGGWLGLPWRPLVSSDRSSLRYAVLLYMIPIKWGLPNPQLIEIIYLGQIQSMAVNDWQCTTRSREPRHQHFEIFNISANIYSMVCMAV